jgi:small-conductance mechanosensitive channel
MSNWLETLGGADWPQIPTGWGLQLVGALAIVLFGLWLARWGVRLIDSGFRRANLDIMLARFLNNVARAVLTVLVLVAALDHLGVPTTSLFAVLGAAGLAIGLALRDSLANIASGVMLITLRPFKVGDVVQIAGQDGEVDQVRIFQTVLRTFSNHEVTLPNSQVTGSPIINFTARQQRRIDIPVGISYDADIAAARDALLTMARGHERVLSEPASDVVVANLGDNSVDLMLRAWVATADFAGTRSDLVEGAHRELSKAGIGIPYPQRDVHLKLPDGVDLSLSRVDANRA